MAVAVVLRLLFGLFLFLLLEIGFCLEEGGFCLLCAPLEGVELRLVELDILLEAWDLRLGLFELFFCAFCAEGLGVC